MTETPAATSGPPVSHARFNWTMVGIALTLLLQSVSLVAWAAKIDQRVATLEQRNQEDAKLAETVARLDERTQALVTTVNRIDARVSEREAAR